MFKKILIVLGAACACLGFAQEMTPEQMQEMMRPPAEMEQVSWVVGDWEADQKMYNPDGSTVTEKGTVSFKMSLGGRYLEQTYKSSYMGMDMMGRQFMTYDPMTEKWVATWLDSTSPGVMVMKGGFGSDGLQLMVEDYDMMGMKADFRQTWMRISDDEMTFKLEMRMDGADWMPQLEGTYKRKK